MYFDVGNPRFFNELRVLRFQSLLLKTKNYRREKNWLSSIARTSRGGVCLNQSSNHLQRFMKKETWSGWESSCLTNGLNWNWGVKIECWVYSFSLGSYPVLHKRNLNFGTHRMELAESWYQSPEPKTRQKYSRNSDHSTFKTSSKFKSK